MTFMLITRRLVLSIPLLIVTMLLPSDAESKDQANEKYAVLVGVTDYPHLEESLWLTGPANDALLMRDVVMSQGVKRENIQLLAEVDDADGLPDKATIVKALQDVALKVAPGDLVFVHMAGHGSQQPVKDDPQEIDGWDENFLPRDVKSWNGAKNELPNAITDNEFAVLFDGIRNRGANLWVVFDSCHSGTITRGSTKMRAVKPAQLGIPAIAPESDPKDSLARSAELEGAVKLRGGDIDKGDIIVFSAAEPQQQTPEMGMEVDGDRVTHGLFTWSLANAINSGPRRNYVELAESIRDSYAQRYWSMSSPVISGTALSSSAFSFDEEAGLGWTVSQKDSQQDRGTISINAGYLQGLKTGGKIGIFSESSGDEALTTATLSEVGPAFSEAFLIAEMDLETASEEGVYALSMEEDARGTQLSVALLDSVTDVSEKQLASQPWIQITSPENADIRVHQQEESLWFLRRAQRLPCMAGETEQSVRELEPGDERCGNEKYLTLDISVNAKGDDIALQGLQRVWQTRQVMQMPTWLGEHQSGRPGPVVEMLVKTVGESTFIAPEPGFSLSAGDEVQVQIHNESRSSFDVILMFVASDLGIYQLFPTPGESARFKPNQKFTWDGVIDGNSKGKEHLLAVAIPAVSGGAEPDLSYLQQPPFAVRSRNLIGKPDAQLRGLGGKPSTAGASATLFAWETKSR